MKCLKCTACGAEYPADTLMNLCPVDQRPVEMVIDIEKLQAEQAATAWYQPDRKDMWRFGGLLPLDIANPKDRQHITTLGEGNTPLLDYSDHPSAQSFKDRGMAMTISMAHYHGLQKLAVPTQGNAGDSLCEYADAAGMSAVIAMPKDTPMPILGRVAALAQASDRFHLKLVEGIFRNRKPRPDRPQVVVFNTGSLEKYLPQLRYLL